MRRISVKKPNWFFFYLNCQVRQQRLLIHNIIVYCFMLSNWRHSYFSKKRILARVTIFHVTKKLFTVAEKAILIILTMEKFNVVYLNLRNTFAHVLIILRNYSAVLFVWLRFLKEQELDFLPNETFFNFFSKRKVLIIMIT